MAVSDHDPELGCIDIHLSAICLGTDLLHSFSECFRARRQQYDSINEYEPRDAVFITMPLLIPVLWISEVHPLKLRSALPAPISMTGLEGISKKRGGAGPPSNIPRQARAPDAHDRSKAETTVCVLAFLLRNRLGLACALPIA